MCRESRECGDAWQGSSANGDGKKERGETTKESKRKRVSLSLGAFAQAVEAMRDGCIRRLFSPSLLSFSSSPRPASSIRFNKRDDWCRVSCGFEQ